MTTTSLGELKRFEPNPIVLYENLKSWAKTTIGNTIKINVTEYFMCLILDVIMKIQDFLTNHKLKRVPREPFSC